MKNWKSITPEDFIAWCGSIALCCVLISLMLVAVFSMFRGVVNYFDSKDKQEQYADSLVCPD